MKSWEGGGEEEIKRTNEASDIEHDCKIEIWYFHSHKISSEVHARPTLYTLKKNECDRG